MGGEWVDAEAQGGKEGGVRGDRVRGGERGEEITSQSARFR